jgi:NAD(P)-dependent dehydrogenase (short-subunit alcohol dehydrogenase family)
LTADDPASAWPDASVLESLAPARLFGLDGAVTVITGASGGVGRWLAAGFAAAGASLLLTDVAPSPMDGIAAALRAAGTRVEELVVDLDDEPAPAAIVAAAVERLGRVDALVNNAGVNRRVAILDVEPAQLDWIWRTNFRQPYLLAQAAARHMAGRSGGAIIHITSITATTGIEDLSLYSPTKAALTQLTRVMAVEWSRFGIRTNAVAPGFLATPMNATHWSHPTRAPWIMERIPMCRPGDPSEVVGACLLLASDAGSYICGQTIFVDGGFLAGSRWDDLPGTGLRTYAEQGGHRAGIVHRAGTEGNGGRRA